MKRGDGRRLQRVAVHFSFLQGRVQIKEDSEKVIGPLIYNASKYLTHPSGLKHKFNERIRIPPSSPASSSTGRSDRLEE